MSFIMIILLRKFGMKVLALSIFTVFVIGKYLVYTYCSCSW